jgi:hypothetical protein
MMRRLLLWSALLGLLLAFQGHSWGQANLPNNPNAATVQGPDPTGELGYPLAVVAATGALPFPVSIAAQAISLCVTQCTSPWITSFNGISQPVTVGNFPATQPVSGTVTANQGTNPWVISGSVSVTNQPSVTTPTLIAAGSYTTTQQSADQTNSVGRRLTLIVNVSAGAGINLTPSLLIKDPISGNYDTYWKGPGINATGIWDFYFADGAGGAGIQFNQVLGVGLPAATWALKMTANNANSITYSVAAIVLP